MWKKRYDKLYKEYKQLKNAKPPEICPLCTSINKLDDDLKAQVRQYVDFLLERQSGTAQPDETKDPTPEYAPPELAPVSYLPGVAAGEPREVFFNQEFYWIEKDKIKHSEKEYAIVGIKGTSMTNAGIYDGDVALIHRERGLRSGQIYLVRHEGEYTLKRYMLDDDGCEYLAYDDGTGRKVEVKPGDWEVVGIFCMAFKPDEGRIRGI